MNELGELFLDELADIYNAESQLLKALPKMARAAQSEALQEAFESHLSETQEHVERAREIFKIFGKAPKGKKCKAMEGLVAEGSEVMEEHKGSANLDAALVCAAQKIEHYEIATYGCLATWAKLLDNEQAYKLIKKTLSEEKEADEKLSDLAESDLNPEARESVSNQRLTSRRGTRPARSLTAR